MEKFVKKYAKIYRTALIENNFLDIDVRVESYVHRLQGMYASQDFANVQVHRRAGIYPAIFIPCYICLYIYQNGC